MSYELTSPPPVTVFPLLADTAYATAGLTLRDHFATAALPGVIAARVALVNANLASDLNQESIAEECYELADAMLAEATEERPDTVFDVAEGFVDDVIQAVGREFTDAEREALIDRAAKAMRQALEQECTAIRQELLDHRDYADVVDSGGPGDPGLERDRQ